MLKNPALLIKEMPPQSKFLSIPIDSGRWKSDTALYPYNHKAVVSVNLGNLTSNSTLRLINDNESEGIFAKYGFYASTATDTSITIFAIDKPLVDVILKAEIVYAEGESGTPIIINPVSIVRKDKLVEILNKTVEEILPSDLEGATLIPDYLFQGCNRLKIADLSNSITSIGQYAFNSCSSLVVIELPKNLTSIGQRAVHNCPSITSLHLPSSLASIGESAFRSNINLKTITIGEGITSLPKSCFLGSSSLESVTIPNSVTSFGEWVFEKCISLKSITIGSGIKNISNGLFMDSTALTKIIINKSCTQLSDVPTLANTSTNTIPANAYIYVPDTTTQSLYRQATNWSSLASRIKLISELEE